MTADLKIALEKDPRTGEMRVPPECMRLLVEFARHRDQCHRCRQAWEKKTGEYCRTGTKTWTEIFKQPGVTLTPSQSG